MHGQIHRDDLQFLRFKFSQNGQNIQIPACKLQYAQFRHRAGKDVHAPGFYVHLEPGGVFAGAGLWHPEPQALQSVRVAIAQKPAVWKKAIGTPSFRKLCTLEGEVAKRPPHGFDPNHALIEDLKRKDFVATARFTEAEALSPAFLRGFISFCQASAPLNAFLSRALKVAW